MNRQQFLRRSLLFSLAAAGLPRLSHALQKGEKESEYKASVHPKGEGEQVYRISILDSRILSSEEDSSIRMVLEAALYKGYSWAADAEAGVKKGRYTLQRIGVPKQEGNYMVCNWKLLPKVEGQDVMKGRLKKTIVTKLYPRFRQLMVLSDSETLTMDFVDPNKDSDDDCFLTTACTAARGLPDDCYELTTLRALRDDHMKASIAGQAMIKEYYRIAPAIVQRVNGLSNSRDIWALVYDDMVRPVVSLSAEGRMEEAVACYAEYTGWMKEAFGADSN